MRKDLKFDEGLTARGTETKNHNTSQLPFSSMSATVNSPQHKAIRKAAYSGKAYLWIVGQMTVAITREAQLAPKPWKLNGSAESLAEIVLHPMIYGEELTDTAAGELMGMSQSAYSQTWKIRVEELQNKYRSWGKG